MFRIIDIAREISSGITPLRSNSEYWENGTIPWLKTEQIGEYRIKTTNEFVTEKALESTGLKLYPKNTISIAMYGEGKTRGNVSIIDCPMTTNQACCNIVVNESIVAPFYLYYFFKTQYHNLRQLSSGVRKNLNSNDIKNYLINLPNKITQQNIVNFLCSIDEKIELNNKINLELEKFAKTLYEYWFVQFDFPDENERPYKSSGGAMVYNEILKRDIPVGWEVENISKYCNIIDCLHSKKPDFCYEANNLYLLQLENLTNDGYIDITNKYYISKDDYKSWTQKIEIQENDFVFTNAGRTGAFGKIPKYIKCALGRNLTAIRPISISPYYLRMYFGSNDMRQQVLSNLDCGAFFKSFNVKSIKLIALLIPQENILNNFILKISPIIKQIETNNIETQFLTEVRDFLLPMLMNGQVTIRQ